MKNNVTFFLRGGRGGYLSKPKSRKRLVHDKEVYFISNLVFNMIFGKIFMKLRKNNLIFRKIFMNEQFFFLLSFLGG